MTEKLWHYVDAQQQKVGPVAASVIREAYQTGRLRPDALVWNSELPQWQRLADHADALGITLSSVNHFLVNGRPVKFANFFHRWAALVIDQWLISLSALFVAACLAVAVYFLAGFSFEKDPENAILLMAASAFAYMLLYIGFGGAYHIHHESSSSQGSFGKRYLGLVVTTDQGGHLDRKTAALRWFSAALSHLSQNIGFLMAAFTQKHQALHDYLAGTLVLERDIADGPAIDRNKRSLVILLLGIFIAPIILAVGFMLPLFYFIDAQEEAEKLEHQKIASLVEPIKKVVAEREAVDQTCLSNEDAEIKALLEPFKPLTVEVFVGLSDDEQNCEVYVSLDSIHYLSYRHEGDGSWSCEVSYKPEEFGENCQMPD